jgi:hypothetical protein
MTKLELLLATAKKEADYEGDTCLLCPQQFVTRQSFRHSAIARTPWRRTRRDATSERDGEGE